MREFTFKESCATPSQQIVNRSEQSPVSPCDRVCSAGKFLRLGAAKWRVRGLTYGPFRSNDQGLHLPSSAQVLLDLQHIKAMGATALRLYELPDRQFLDGVLAAGLRVLLDVPWEKHRCFFEDWAAQQDAIQRVRRATRELGTHPAVMAISVANEIPKDVVRFYGVRRIERFIDNLIDTVKQQASDCLSTYTNYPSTEFLMISRQDFVCMNVYLDDPHVFGRYLLHLQHVAGGLPLILGEYGLDSTRNGEQAQAVALSRHVHEVQRHGLAGSFIFSYTDDWFTGGHSIADWAFGITDRNRNEKLAARRLRNIWRGKAPTPSETPTPSVSVIVCSYNGGATLRECLSSLVNLDYPTFEVILVDDGSTDATPQIANEFPTVRYIGQQNQGLSVARNVGAHAARGQIVAYTDSDCIADETWLTYLAQGMQAQQADAIGGPNLPPFTDNWVAKCVAASPGGPSHVMLNDHRAEHVPGCNMAFYRSKLLDIGGFDAQFRAAGDDVDICWRFLEAGLQIGYAPAALVWHHRRNTIGAYLKQQQGYGRAEAMLHFKYPGRFNGLGCSRWHGIIYGDGAVGLPVTTPAVYHGRFGNGLFQIVYRTNDYALWGYFTLVEWHGIALLFASLAIVLPSMLLLWALMLALSMASAARSTMRAPLPRNAPIWCRLLVFGLYLLQPIVRGWSRYRFWFRSKRLPRVSGLDNRIRFFAKSISDEAMDLYWLSSRDRGREHFLDALVEQVKARGWHGNLESEWTNHDVELIGTVWHDIRLHTATEQLGWPKRFTRVRCSLRLTQLSYTAFGVTLLWTLAAVTSRQDWAMAFMLILWSAFLLMLRRSHKRCMDATMKLIWSTGRIAGLKPVAAAKRKLQRRRREDRNRADGHVSDPELCVPMIMTAIFERAYGYLTKEVFNEVIP